jgi:molybdopterin molybdotransferase
LIATAGTTVSPALAGLLAATGHDQVAVHRRPRVSLLLLGDELLTSGVPTGGRIRDSLGPQVPGWIARAGGLVVATEHVPDTVATTRQALQRHAATSDLLITTGGTAAGPRDHLHAALAEVAGTLQVNKVRVKPGHPMLLAEVPRPGGDSSLHPVPLVGLPGNPHSAVVGLVTLAVPLLDGMLAAPPRTASARPGRPACRPGHTRLIAGRLVDGTFTLSGYPGSAMLRGLAQSDGFAVVTRTCGPAWTSPGYPCPRRSPAIGAPNLVRTPGDHSTRRSGFPATGNPAAPTSPSSRCSSIAPCRGHCPCTFGVKSVRPPILECSPQRAVRKTSRAVGSTGSLTLIDRSLEACGAGQRRWLRYRQCAPRWCTRMLAQV